MGRMCSVCERILAYSAFARYKRARDGRAPQCKECRKIADSKHYWSTVEEHKIAWQEWKEKNRPAKPKKARSESYYAQIGKERTQRKNLQKGNVPSDCKEFLIEIYGDLCMNPFCTRKITDSNSLTLDHVVPLRNGGLHCISNMQLLCKGCNSAKSNKHSADFRLIKVYDG